VNGVVASNYVSLQRRIWVLFNRWHQGCIHALVSPCLAGATPHDVQGQC
jgi:hypothetical protein